MLNTLKSPKLIFFLPILIFGIAVIAYLFYMRVSDLNSSFQNHTVISDSRNLETLPTLVPTKEKYTLEYFEQANREGRVLSNDEKAAYAQLNLKKNTILYSVLNSEQFNCVITDSEKKETLKLFLYSKGGMLRIEGKKLSDGQVVSSFLSNKTDQWNWSYTNSRDNVHLKYKDDLQRYQLLAYSLWNNADSVDVFSKSCTRTIVEDKWFSVPTGISFTEMED